MRNALVAGAVLLALSACTTGVDARTVSQPASLTSEARCSTDMLALETNFPSGALASCEIDEDGDIKVMIAPEDAPPINCSPWYSFRLHSAEERKVEITLRYEACGHRYWPKISSDGVNWQYLPQRDVRVSEFAGSDQARITVRTTGEPVFISAQEIIVPATYDAWLDGVEGHAQVTREMLGKSAQGRDIEMIRIGDPQAREQILLVGRQHPPEVTGALAMFPFMETLLGDDPLARRFRDRFQVTAVPLVNPDGVVLGYWRHNTGGVDLNRDWGPWTQPETRLMRDLLEQMDTNPDQQLRLMLDFHSTNRDVFYTIPDELPTDPPLFTRDWLERYQERMPGYDVDRDARHAAGRPISKAYVFDTYGVPAITFELGDETDRNLVRRIGREAAIAMMETLLATDPGE